MPLPLLLGIAAVVAATTGGGMAVHGAVQMKKANDKFKEAQERHDANVARQERMNTQACRAMDTLGEHEMKICSEFKLFSDLVERIHNKPEFADIKIGNVSIPKFDGEKIKKVAIGAAVLMGGLKGAALGTAGGFAAAGATTAAVAALGTASTGTAIATLSGAALTNATLAALGGGAIAAGGGGIATGAAVLGGATLGVGLLVGGVVFALAGSKISGKAEEAWKQMLANEEKIIKICTYLSDLRATAESYNYSLSRMHSLYLKQLANMQNIIESRRGYRVNWFDLSIKEQRIIENTILIVTVLYDMCKVQLVLVSYGSQLNTINKADIRKAENAANNVLARMSDD